MSVARRVSEEEYLHTGYEPEWEYEDGVLIERNLGTEPHSWLQCALGAYLFHRRKQWGIQVYMSQHTRLRPGKYMIPDLCVVLGERPAEPIFGSPPLIWIEILSPEDRPFRVNRKVREILDFGVRYVWVIDPETLESDLHTAAGSRALLDGILKIKGTPIEVPLRALDED